MKRFFKIVCFWVIFLIVAGVVSLFLMPKNNTKEDGIEHEKAHGILAEKDDSIDILIVGDSEAYTSIIPLKLWEDCGYTSYLCCTPAQNLSDSAYFTYLGLKNQSPKIVILEADNIFREVPVLSAFEKATNLTVPLLKYHDRWKELKLEDFSSLPNYTWTDYLKGYKFTDSIKEADSTKYMRDSSKSTDIPLANKQYVETIKKYCEYKGAELIIVSTPSVRNWNYEKHNSLVEFAEEQDIEFLDLNVFKDIINIDWKHDSKDGGDHLNYYGAIKVTDYLEDYFKDMNIFEDHRNDEYYSGWDDCLEQFHEFVNTELSKKKE